MFRSNQMIRYLLKKSSKWILLYLLIAACYIAYLVWQSTVPDTIPQAIEKETTVVLEPEQPIKKVPSHKPKTVAQKIPLAIPVNLKGTKGDAKKITLFWDASPGATSYEVYRQDSAKAPFKRIAKDIKESLYIDQSVESNHHYFYKVKALNKHESTALSAPTEAFAKGAKVGGISASQGLFTSSIKLSWQDTGNRTYNIYRSKKLQGNYILLRKANKHNYFSDDKLDSCSHYYYKISGVDAHIESELSPWVSGYTTCIAWVKNFAGSGKMGDQNAKNLLEASFNRPVGVAFHQGILYIADSFNHQIRSINIKGELQTLVNHRSHKNKVLYRPTGVAVDSHGNIFTTEVDNHIIRKIYPSGKMTVFAGNGMIGDKDGIGTKARFNKPYQIMIDVKDNLYVTEFGNHKIRKISPRAKVETFAGNGESGKRDGSRLYARFNQPTGIVQDSRGNIFISDGNNHNIRKITTDGKVHTFAGNTQSGDKDGIGVLATFNDPRGLGIDKYDNIYVADTGNHKIRMIAPDGTVKTLAGSIQKGDCEGLGNDARFFSPRGLVVDNEGFIYVTDFHSHKIKRIELERSNK